MKTGQTVHRLITTAIFFLGFFGFAAIIILAFHIISEPRDVQLNLILFAFLYLATAKWAADLPSGAKFRPAMSFVLSAVLIFPYQDVLFVPLFATLFLAIINKESWKDVFITFGHLAIAIYPASFVYHWMSPEQFITLPALYLPITIALVLHFLINRVISALIVAYRKKIRLKAQLSLIRNDFNWVYLSVYLLSIQTALVFESLHFWGTLSSVLLLITIYKAMSCFQRYQVVAKRAVTDALTGAENRAAWELFVDEMGKNPSSGTLMMIDLDNFKHLNDQYGHSFGDEKLKEFVTGLKTMIKPSYRLFRYGEDEFILYLFHSDEDFRKVTEEINNVLRKINQSWCHEELILSTSSGITQIHIGEAILSQLNKVDEMMYREKYLKKQTHAQVVTT